MDPMENSISQSCIQKLPAFHTSSFTRIVLLRMVADGVWIFHASCETLVGHNGTMEGMDDGQLLPLTWRKHCYMEQLPYVHIIYLLI